MNKLPTKINVTGGLTEVKAKDLRKAERSFKVEYNRIIEQARELALEAEINSLVYNSEFNFEPLVGDIYHLYKRRNGVHFLSLIGPEEGLRQEYIGSYMLDEKRVWKKIETD